MALQASGLAAAVDKAGLDDAALHVLLVGPRHIRALNRRFLGRDATTDVLAFDLRDGPRVEADGPTVVAEIYVCLQVAVEAAVAYNTTIGSEVVLYIAHGLLHLTGLDDDVRRSRRLMRLAEDRLLRELRGVVDVDEIF